ncbi:alpha/beta hydrolase, partial [Burkholderia cenocepacia]|nr:alpha/beta hydrolase [Burkholderia cenocepacia]
CSSDLFTLTYRWITRFTGMSAYRLSQPLPAAAAPLHGTMVAPPAGRLEAFTAASLRGFLRVAFRPLIGPPFGARMQRRVVTLLSPLMPGAGGTLRYRTSAQR